MYFAEYFACEICSHQIFITIANFLQQMKDLIQTQYESDYHRIYTLLQPEFKAMPKHVDEDELVCELVELYEKIYYPMNEAEAA